MQNIGLPILIATMFIIAVNLMLFIGVAISIIATCLFLAPIVVIWMVVKTLKDGVPSQKTFETHWYEDQVV